VVAVSPLHDLLLAPNAVEMVLAGNLINLVKQKKV
jgi:hypothetical protein